MAGDRPNLDPATLRWVADEMDADRQRAEENGGECARLARTVPERLRPKWIEAGIKSAAMGEHAKRVARRLRVLATREERRR